MSTKVITGRETVFSYLNIREPKCMPGSDIAKYSVCLLIPKSDKVTAAKIKAAIQEAYEQGQGKLRGSGKSVPKLETLKLPLRDGDKERPDDPAYAGKWFLNATSRERPGVVDADRNDILDLGEMYSGVIGRASITFFAFNTNGNRGIACGLNHLQKLKDGTPLGGRGRAADDFDDLDEEDDDLDFLV